MTLVWSFLQLPPGSVAGVPSQSWEWAEAGWIERARVLFVACIAELQESKIPSPMVMLGWKAASSLASDTTKRILTTFQRG